VREWKKPTTVSYKEADLLKSMAVKAQSRLSHTDGSVHTDHLASGELAPELD
jgi:hypothetical protein